MEPQQAVDLAGGTRAKLIRIFESRGFPLTRQALMYWFKVGRIPNDRLAQLKLIRPKWFESNGA